MCLTALFIRDFYYKSFLCPVIPFISLHVFLSFFLFFFTTFLLLMPEPSKLLQFTPPFNICEVQPNSLFALHGLKLTNIHPNACWATTPAKLKILKHPLTQISNIITSLYSSYSVRTQPATILVPTKIRQASTLLIPEQCLPFITNLRTSLTYAISIQSLSAISIHTNLCPVRVSDV